MALTGLTNLQPLHIKTVGIGTFDNAVSIGGTLTYEDVTNVDAIGIITARSGINVSGGQLDVGSNIKLGNAGVITATSFVGSGSGLTGLNSDLVNDSSPQLGGALDVNGNNINFGDSSGSSDDRLKFGASNDMVIYHDGTRNIIDSQSSQLRIETDALRLRSDAGETYLEADANAALKIYHNNALKFDTITTGIRVHGDEGGTAQLQLLADQGDDNPDYWRFIAETNGILNIQDYGSGNWYNNLRLTGNTGGVELFHDNQKKFFTSSGGVTVEATNNEPDITFRGASNLDLGKIEINQFATNYSFLRMYTLANGTQTEWVRLLDNGNFCVGGMVGSTSNNNIQSPGQGNGNTNVGSAMWTTGRFICNSASTFSSFGRNSTGLVLSFTRQGGDQGGITVGVGYVSYGSGSDYRLKENVAPLTDAITRIKQLEPKRFNFIQDTTDTLRDGFLAHEVSSIVPEAITGTKDEVDSDNNPVYQQIDQAKLVPLLTASIQELITKVETLEQENIALRIRVTNLEDN